MAGLPPAPRGRDRLRFINRQALDELDERVQQQRLPLLRRGRVIQRLRQGDYRAANAALRDLRDNLRGEMTRRRRRREGEDGVRRLAGWMLQGQFPGEDDERFQRRRRRQINRLNFLADRPQYAADAPENAILVVSRWVVARLPGGEVNPDAEDDRAAPYRRILEQSLNYQIERDLEGELITITFYVPRNEIIEKLDEIARTLRKYPYAESVRLIEALVDDQPVPIPRGFQRMRLAVLNREGLLNPDGSGDGMCIFRAFAQVLEGCMYSPRTGVRGRPINEELVIDVARGLIPDNLPLTAGLTDAEASELYKTLGGTYFRVFDGLLRENKGVSWKVERGERTNVKYRKPGIILVHLNGHAYIYTEKENEKKTKIQFKRPSLYEKLDVEDSVITEMPPFASDDEENWLGFLNNLERKIIYSTTSIMPLFLRSIQVGKVPLIYKVKQSGEITHYMLDGRHYIYAPDALDCQSLIKTLNKRWRKFEVVYRGQTVQSILLQALPYYNIPPSRMTPGVYLAFMGPLFDSYTFNAWVKPVLGEEMKLYHRDTDIRIIVDSLTRKLDLVYFDIKRSFTAVATQFPLPIHDLNDEIVEYKGGDVIDHYWYRVEDCSIFPLMYPGKFYIGYLVRECMYDGVIARKQITHVLPAAMKTNPEHFERVRQDIEQHCLSKGGKLAFNSLVGAMKRTAEMEKEKLVFSSDEQELKDLMVEYPGSDLHEYTFNIRTKKDGTEVFPAALKNMGIDEGVRDREYMDHREMASEIFRKIDWRERFHVLRACVKVLPQRINYMSQHCAVPQLNNLLLYRHLKTLTGLAGKAALDKLYVVCTDCIGIHSSALVVDPPQEVEGSKLGDITQSRPPRIKHEYQPGESLARKSKMPPPQRPKILTREDVMNGMEEWYHDPLYGEGPLGFSLCIHGGAGSGKTFLMAQLYKIYKERGVKVHWLTPTHDIGSMTRQDYGIETQTVASAIGWRAEKTDVECKKKNVFTLHDIVFIDEVFMLSEDNLLGLHRLADHYVEKKGGLPVVIMAGDTKQLKPIGMRKTVDLYNSIIQRLCWRFYCLLEGSKRNENDPDRARLQDIWDTCRKGLSIDTTVFPSRHVPTAISASRTARGKVNLYWSHKLSNGQLRRVKPIKFGIFEGQLLRCCVNNEKYHNGQLFTLSNIGELLKVKPVLDIHKTGELMLHPEEFEKIFIRGYCGTLYSKQGVSLDEYSIYELKEGTDWWGNGHRYSALTRGRKLQGINICDIKEIDAYLEQHNIMPNSEVYIYLITNKTNGKQYIGSTNNLTARKAEHASATPLEGDLHRAIHAEGWKNFTMKKIDEVAETGKAELFRIERHYTDLYNTWAPNGYNVYAQPNT